MRVLHAAEEGLSVQKGEGTMPREVEYWRRRHLGLCVECDQVCTTARCGACQERRKLWGDRSGDRTLRDPGIKRRLAGHREAREVREAKLRTGTPLGPKPSKAVRKKMERAQSAIRKTARRPGDGKLPRTGITLDGIPVDWWTINGEDWRWPAGWDEAAVTLRFAPAGWRLNEMRWITLAWKVDGIEAEQEVEILVKVFNGPNLRLGIKGVA